LFTISQTGIGVFTHLDCKDDNGFIEGEVLHVGTLC
jgi:hypothetical protein